MGFEWVPYTPLPSVLPLDHCGLQRHLGVNNLPKVVTRQRGDRRVASPTPQPLRVPRSMQRVKVIRYLECEKVLDEALVAGVVWKVLFCSVLERHLCGACYLAASFLSAAQYRTCTSVILLIIA